MVAGTDVELDVGWVVRSLWGGSVVADMVVVVVVVVVVGPFWSSSIVSNPNIA